MIIDTHAHLMFEDFEGDVLQVLERAKSVGVEKIINIGCDDESSAAAVDLANKYEEMYATIGFHPYDAADCSEDVLDVWKSKLQSGEWKKVVAVGECGLDFYKGTAPANVQKRAFEMQLEFALACELPVVIHNRDADEECLEILEKYDGVRAVFHCFGSDLNFAEKVWARGFMTSITGIITFNNAEELRRVVKAALADKLMVETDCPYLAPEGMRGERNEPANVVKVVEKIAEVRGLKTSDMLEVLKENSLKFFNLA